MAKTGPKGPMKPISDKDWERLINMIRIQCTATEIASVFGMSEDTLGRRIKERGEGNFAELFKKHADEGKVSLRRSMYRSAVEKNNVPMQIFLSKQWLGYSDKQEHSGPDGGPVIHKIERVIIDPKNNKTT